MPFQKKIRFLRMNVPRWALIVLFTVVVVYIVVEINIKPVIIALAETKVRSVAVTAMNNTVLETLGKDDIKYSDLMEVKYDEYGNVSMIQANTISINKIASNVAKATQSRLEEISEMGVNVPLGSVLGGQLFAGKGPSIHITVIAAGSVDTEFISEFTSAGINQTRHRIILKLTTTMAVVAPVGSSNIKAVTQVAVAESIIVGDVPDSYVNVDNEDDMLNLLPLE